MATSNHFDVRHSTTLQLCCALRNAHLWKCCFKNVFLFKQLSSCKTFPASHLELQQVWIGSSKHNSHQKFHLEGSYHHLQSSAAAKAGLRTREPTQAPEVRPSGEQGAPGFVCRGPARTSPHLTLPNPSPPPSHVPSTSPSPPPPNPSPLLPTPPNLPLPPQPPILLSPPSHILKFSSPFPSYSLESSSPSRLVKLLKFPLAFLTVLTRTFPLK